MANCWHHAVSSAKRYGGEPDEYLKFHKWFDLPKTHIGDFRQRALRHHTLGIAELVAHFGETLTVSTGRIIPVQFLGEQHLVEDFGRIPSVQDWLRCLQPEPWMTRGARRLSVELEEART